ncbi:hypothetical protein HYW60_00630 [Candidatus Kaiserbacteria bacterium]|nr:hypothetical protein [Candidatus Kaiserbacteria bacterium]
MAKAPLWSIERIKAGLKRFHQERGRYPTATEFDEYQYLPRAKTIERRFGGLIALRKQLELGDEHDFRAGSYSSQRAHTINKRAHEQERIVYDFLIKRFGKEFVHREYFFTDDHRTRADFFVYDHTHGFCVDVFYPASLRNLTGCLNIKLKKYAGSSALLRYPVIFLQMNENIEQYILDTLINKKKRELGSNQALMSWDTFQRYCRTRKPLRISSLSRQDQQSLRS